MDLGRGCNRAQPANRFGGLRAVEAWLQRPQRQVLRLKTNKRTDNGSVKEVEE